MVSLEIANMTIIGQMFSNTVAFFLRRILSIKERVTLFFYELRVTKELEMEHWSAFNCKYSDTQSYY